MDENAKFEELVDAGIEEYFQRNPRVAVNFGKEEYEKTVESGTKEHIEENLRLFGQWLEKLKKLDNEKLNFENQISLKALEYYHEINLFKHEAFPLWKKDPNGLECFQEITFLLFQRKGPTTDVAEAIIAHLINLPKYLEEFQSRFDGTPIPIVWRDLALEKAQTTPNILQTLINAYNKTTAVPNSIKNKLYETIKELKPVIKTHIEWITNRPVNNDDFAWALGLDKFDRLLRLRKLPWDRQTLMKKGTQIFNSAYKKVKRIAKETYPDKTLGDAIDAFFKEDLISTLQDVLEYARSEAIRARKFIESHDLATLPFEKLTIIETPDFLKPIIVSAAYIQSPYFNSNQPGIFILSPLQKGRLSRTMISDWMVHEAYPGHHLDFSCNNAFSPLIRLLGIAYESVEGWALYCEKMMLEQGFFKDPKKSRQLISGMELQFAINIILDIQLHCKQRSMAEASEMLMNVLQMEETAAKAAVTDWTTSPTYPLSYLTGKLLIEELRIEVEEKMGSRFNLKDFHDTILKSGGLPYFLLKEYFEDKIRNLSIANQ